MQMALHVGVTLWSNSFPYFNFLGETQCKINLQSLEDTQVGYILQKYTLDKYTLEEYTLENF